MLTIDGAVGEGGGQIIRTALTLSLVTRLPFRAINVRARRHRPGLLRQHLTAVEAAARISGARVEGAALGSRELLFEPGEPVPGRYAFSVGTAGSATLVLQTLLPALLTAAGPSHLTLEGGTHNPLAPPFDFLEKVFLPLVRRMGPHLAATLHRHGFFPAGGGRFTVEITPAPRLARLDLPDRGEIRACRARALVARLPPSIAERELAVVERKLGWDRSALHVEIATRSAGPGNALSLEIESEHITEVFTGFGQRGVRAEAVADAAVSEVRRYLAAGVPVGPHLADQLLVPMALAGGGSFRTLAPTQHTRTQFETISRFLDVAVRCEQLDRDAFQIEVGAG
jgi:RNA 3'-terminal phosphate cyclase (ATP)